MHFDTADDPVPASRWRRLATAAIDTAAMLLLAVIVYGVLALALGDVVDAWFERAPDLVFGSVLQLIYYVPQECLWGRTLGKLLAGTRIIGLSGTAPTCKEALVRTACRLIPFEPLSAFRPGARMWHDSVADTWVIRHERRKDSGLSRYEGSN